MEKMSKIGPCVAIFGSARTQPGDKYYEMAVEIAEKLADYGFILRYLKGKEFGEDCGEPLDYVKEAVNVIKEEKPTLFAVYFGGLDETGHTYGWYTEKYYDFEKVLDECIAQLIEATKEAGIYDDTIFVLTADHGGIDKGHGGMTLEEMLSPFIVYGKGIRKGFQMTDAMMQYDVAATVAYILGLETPQAWVGRPMLSIFE